MCGRFAFATKRETLKRQFKVDNLLDDPPVSYNVAPTQQIPIIREEPGTERLISTAHWGLIPFWARDSKMAHQTINARAETLRDATSGSSSAQHCTP